MSVVVDESLSNVATDSHNIDPSDSTSDSRGKEEIEVVGEKTKALVSRYILLSDTLVAAAFARAAQLEKQIETERKETVDLLEQILAQVCFLRAVQSGDAGSTDAARQKMRANLMSTAIGNMDDDLRRFIAQLNEKR